MMKHSSIGIAIALMAMMSPVPATGEVYLQGDTNGDGEINIGDVNVILNNILAEGEYDYHYDLAKDSLINIGDVNDVLSRIITGEREWIRTAEGLGADLLPEGQTTFLRKGGMNGQIVMYSRVHNTAVAWHSNSPDSRVNSTATYIEEFLSQA